MNIFSQLNQPFFLLCAYSSMTQDCELNSAHYPETSLQTYRAILTHRAARACFIHTCNAITNAIECIQHGRFSR